MENDEELVNKILQGDEMAFSALLDRFEGKVYKLSLAYVGNLSEAEDLTQEIFLKVYKKLSLYLHKASLSTWIYRVAANTCKSYLRHKRIVEFISLDWIRNSSLQDSLESAGHFEKDVEEKELGESLYKIMAMLPDKYKEILILREIEEMDYVSIGKYLKINVGTVKSRINRAKQQLKIALKEKGYSR